MNPIRVVKTRPYSGSIVTNGDKVEIYITLFPLAPTLIKMTIKSTLGYFLLSLLVVSILSCTSNIPIAYRLDIQEVSENHHLKNVVLSVLEFKDLRRKHRENTPHFTNPRNCFLDGKNMCINAEKHYHKVPAASQFSMILTKRFETDYSFQQVVYNGHDSADYYVSGNLVQFNGRQEFSSAAAVGAQFGLIGALATSGAKTPGRIVIEIDSLKVYDANQSIVKDFGNVYQEVEDRFPADAYCWAIYHNVNNVLKEFHTDLIDRVVEAIVDHEASRSKDDQ